MKLLTSSPKTTVWGIVTAIGGVLVALNTIDGAEDAFNELFTNGSTWASIVGTVLIAIGAPLTAGAARDNHKTSEETGAK